MRKIWLGVLLGTLGMVTACASAAAGHRGIGQIPVEKPSAVTPLVAAAARENAPTAEKQAYELTDKLFLARAKNSNLVFSPYCFQQILPLIRDNTKQASTRQELLPYIVPGIRVEKLRNTKTGELILLNKQLARDYTGGADGDLKLVAYPDEALAAKKAFQMKILDSIIDGAAPQGDLNFLTAAHYFAEWETKFDKKLTKPRDFTNENGQVEKVATMQQHFTDGRGASTDTYDMAAVWGKNRSVVYFIKPKKDAAAVAANLDQIVKDFEQGKNSFHNINLQVPKLNIKNKIDLKDLLKNDMGIASFFTGVTFDKITGKVPYVLATASQTATLDINEDYAEGKAITEIGFRVTAALEVPVVHDIKMDSPYFIVIKDLADSGLRRTVFTAFVADPAAK
jgi:serine protease inhibitor